MHRATAFLLHDGSNPRRRNCESLGCRFYEACGVVRLCESTGRVCSVLLGVGDTYGPEQNDRA
jgi:hypothetical protein